MRFKDKVVIVTGGGQGIGRAVSRAFAAEGAKIVIADIDTEAGQENEQYILRNGGSAYYIETDVALEESVSFSKERIRVNSISPGWIDVTEWQKSSKAKPAVLSEADHLQHPAGRVGTPDDIAKACMFLCSDDAGFITGTNLTVDGGMTIKMIYV